MKKFKPIALFMALVMCMSLLAACGNNNVEPSNSSNPTETTGGDSATNDGGTTAANDTIVVSVEQGLEGKFSPFFAQSAADNDIANTLTLYTGMTDRVANVILEGIAGETHSYNGTDYDYNAPADLTITENGDGSVWYDIHLRDDIVFSDGTPADIDDVIFGLYVYLDPTYDGSTTLYSYPIEGVDEYRSGMDMLYKLIYASGSEGYTENDFYTEEQYETFWNEALETAGVAFTQSIVDYCINAGYNTADDDMSVIAESWGFTVAEGGTVEDYWHAIEEAYAGDYEALSDTEAASASLWNYLPDEFLAGISTGDGAANVSGIQRLDDYTVRIVTTELSAPFIYQTSLPIAPLHWYGDESLYDYDNNSFGFPKGDLSIVKSKTTTPLGAGAYVFKEYSNGVVYMDANPTYYNGEPKIAHLNYLESSEDNKVAGVVAGTLDVADPSYDTNTAKQIAVENGFSEDEWENFDGPIMTTKLIDYRGYGYIGIAASNVNVGGEPGSDASKALRKAIATVLAVYRDEAIDSYYGNTAYVINYPISSTNWAAPQTTDPGYTVAYSVKPDGSPIYSASMSAEDRYAAALEASLEWFEAAGYTVEDGKLTAAPAGAALEYEAILGGGGSGSHPSFLLLKNASEAFATIGFNLIVTDLANSSDLYSAYQNDQAEIWCAAWQSTADPDMFQLYHSNGPSNYYKVFDDDLDELIMQGRSTTDQAARKTIYQAAMDIIVSDWAVEVPIYQRSDCNLFSTQRVKIDTLPSDMTVYYGWLDSISTVEVQ